MPRRARTDTAFAAPAPTADAPAAHRSLGAILQQLRVRPARRQVPSLATRLLQSPRLLKITDVFQVVVPPEGVHGTRRLDGITIAPCETRLPAAGLDAVRESAAATHVSRIRIPRPVAATARWAVVGGGIMVLVAAMLWFAASQGYFWRDPLANAQFSRLTDWAGTEQAAISRDGRSVVFVADHDGRNDVWITEGGSDRYLNLTRGGVSDLVNNPEIRTLGSRRMARWSRSGHANPTARAPSISTYWRCRVGAESGPRVPSQPPAPSPVGGGVAQEDVVSHRFRSDSWNVPTSLVSDRSWTAPERPKSFMGFALPEVLLRARGQLVLRRLRRRGSGGRRRRRSTESQRRAVEGGAEQCAPFVLRHAPFQARPEPVSAI